MKGHIAKKARAGGDVFYVVINGGTDANGKRKQRWHGPYKTREEAESQQRRLVTAVEDGGYIEPQKLTVESFLVERWLPAVKSTLRENTWAGYKRIIEQRIIPRLGHVRLQRLSPDDLNRAYAELLEGGKLNGKTKTLSPKSVHNAHAVIRHALNDAVRWGYVTRNVALSADPPKTKSAGATMKTWTAQEVRAFLDGMATDRLSALWVMLATTGMRRGEVAGLAWESLDLDAGRAQVKQTLVVVEGKVVASEPKTARGWRSVALDKTTIAALRDHRRRQLEERMAAGSGWADTGLVFTREDGSALHPDALTQGFERAVKRLRLPRIRLHDLRHTWASLALAAGIPAKVVSERLGHSSIAITLDIYSHVSPALEEDAADRVAALVFAPAG